MINNFSFRVHVGEKEYTLKQDELERYADRLGLNRMAEGRYSWLFVANLIFNERVNGIDPYDIVDELKDLEVNAAGRGTKPASEFKYAPLRGLWHKHYFSAHFAVKNLLNSLAGDRLQKIVDETCDPQKSPVITSEMVNELAHRVTFETFDRRSQADKLTGEWIIFAKYQGHNYYLCLATHNTGDQEIYNRIKSVCLPQFSFMPGVLTEQG